MPEPMESVTAPVSAISSGERLLAALAHGSVLFSIFGPLIPGLVWISQRRKSRYAAFQALQAMGYQALLLWVGLTVVLTGMLVFIFSGLPLSAETGLTMDSLLASPLMRRAILLQNIFYGIWVVLCLPGFVGAVFAAMGREFHYPLLGRRLESRLRAESGEAWFDEGREEAWVAGICHASAIVLLWGMLLPGMVWSSQKERSAYLRFQALQAFLFQLLALVSTFIALGLLFVMLIAVAALAGYSTSAQGISSDAGLYLLVAIFVILLFMTAVLLALPTYHLFALIAWTRVAQGGNYRYPLLGKLIEKRQKKTGTRESN